MVPTFKILKDSKIVKEVTGAKFDDLVAAIEAVRSSWICFLLSKSKLLDNKRTKDQRALQHMKNNDVWLHVSIEPYFYGEIMFASGRKETRYEKKKN